MDDDDDRETKTTFVAERYLAVKSISIHYTTLHIYKINGFNKNGRKRFGFFFTLFF